MEPEELEDETEMIINQTDGLNLSDIADDNHLNTDEDSSFTASGAAPPNSILIVTSIIEPVFTSADTKLKFESLFLAYDPEAQFQYLKSFRRARVVYTSTEAAEKACSAIHNSLFIGHPIQCYFSQPILLGRAPGPQHLEPPQADKQFLISPPASPPVGWEVINERQPAINYELIAAMAKMGPGSSSYELHTGNESQPSIVVHVSEDPEDYEARPPKIPQTRCPDRKP